VVVVVVVVMIDWGSWCFFVAWNNNNTRLGARTDLGAPCHQGLEVVLCLVDDGGEGRVGG
jgi:hypothetical protein